MRTRVRQTCAACGIRYRLRDSRQPQNTPAARSFTKKTRHTRPLAASQRASPFWTMGRSNPHFQTLYLLSLRKRPQMLYAAKIRFLRIEMALVTSSCGTTPLPPLLLQDADHLRFRKLLRLLAGYQAFDSKGGVGSVTPRNQFLVARNRAATGMSKASTPLCRTQKVPPTLSSCGLLFGCGDRI